MVKKITNTISIAGGRAVHACISTDNNFLYTFPEEVGSSTDKNTPLFIWNDKLLNIDGYNLQTGEKITTTLSAISTDENCLPQLSPNKQWVVQDTVNHTHLDVYNVNTGEKVIGFTISSTTGKGAVLAWANDHTFIYNTTQQLIYFDIKQNKVIKQLPIIRP